MGSHFVGGYWLDFSLTGQETETSILQAFGSGWSQIAWKKKNNNDKVPYLSVLDENAYKDVLRKASDWVSTSTTKK